MKEYKCPYCDTKPIRLQDLGGFCTCCYYSPVYNEKGENTNPDGNRRTNGYMCLNCKKRFGVKSQYGEEDEIIVGVNGNGL